jgi:hypothetical protein
MVIPRLGDREEEGPFSLQIVKMQHDGCIDKDKGFEHISTT